jgi:hypothetical protein
MSATEEQIQAGARAMCSLNYLRQLQRVEYNALDVREREHWEDLARVCITVALSSTDRHGLCQCCGETKDLKCGPSRFGAETWACADCWDPDGKLVPPAHRGGAT